MSDPSLNLWISQQPLQPNGSQTLLWGSDGRYHTFIADGDEGAWLEVPYGADPMQYLSSSPEERLGLQQLGSELETRDTNRGAVLGAYGQQSALDASVNEQLTAAENDRLAQEASLLTQTRNADAGLYGDVAEATDTANQQALGTLGMLGGLYSGAQASEDAATGYLGSETQQANARAGAFLSELEDQSVEAEQRGAGALEYLETAYPQNLQAGQDALRSLADTNEQVNEGTGPWGIGEVTGYEDRGDGVQEPVYGRPAYDPFEAIDSEAADAEADPFDVASQRDALARFQQAADDSQNLQSRAATAQADPSAIENQGDAMALWRAYAGFDDRRDHGDTIVTGMAPVDDIVSREAVAYADPEAVAAQKTALADFLARSSGDLTATERFNMELARTGEERDRRAAMSSLTRDLRERGVGGSGAEVAGLLGTQQQIGQTRMLQDMAALSAAQERADRNLSQYANLGGQIRDQSFGEEARRGEAWDEMALANRANRMGALEQMTGLSSAMRGQSFGEQFQTGQAADEMALAQADDRLAALSQYGDLSSRMREQGFSEQYQTGSAEDAIRQFNATQQQSSERWQQEFNQEADRQAFLRQQTLAGMTLDEAQRAWDVNRDLYEANRTFANDDWARQQQLGDTMLDQNQLSYARAGDLYDAYTGSTARQYDRGTQLGDTAFDVGQQNYQRSTDLAGTGTDLNAINYSRNTDYLDSVRQAQADYYGRQRDSAADTANYLGLYTDQGQAAQAGISSAYQGQLAQRSADRALAALNQDDEDLLSRLSFGVL